MVSEIYSLEPIARVAELASALLLRGKIVICPTDTIYGFSCLATDENAIRQVLEIKGKSGPLIVLILKDWVNRYVEFAERFVTLFKLWDKRVTLILPSKVGSLPSILYGEKNGIALRAPRFPFLVELLTRLGMPIVSTSANKLGESPISDPNILYERFKDSVSLIVDAGIINGKPSTIVDCLEFPRLKVLREGTVSRLMLKRELKNYEII